jgi:hypothetical protein
MTGRHRGVNLGCILNQQLCTAAAAYMYHKSVTLLHCIIGSGDKLLQSGNSTFGICVVLILQWRSQNCRACLGWLMRMYSSVSCGGMQCQSVRFCSPPPHTQEQSMLLAHLTEGVFLQALHSSCRLTGCAAWLILSVSVSPSMCTSDRPTDSCRDYIAGRGQQCRVFSC